MQLADPINTARPVRWQRHRLKACEQVCLRRLKREHTDVLARARGQCTDNCHALMGKYARRAGEIHLRLELAAQEAAIALARLNITSGKVNSVCSPGGPTIIDRREREVVNVTRDKKWRYFTLLECERKLCLVFKNTVESSRIHFAHVDASDGLHFELSTHQTPHNRHPIPDVLFDGSELVDERDKHSERLMAHNVAVLRLPSSKQSSREGEYIFVGGLGPQGGRSPSRQREGIRVTSGTGWPWRKKRYSAPTIALTGYAPTRCLDRRPSRMHLRKEVDQAAACEFDGRLSLVQHQGTFRLFARANLHEGAMSGGRYVQTTSTTDVARWVEPWQPICIRGLRPGTADLYFFAAQTNPIEPSSLLALFPLSHPPHACIGLSFSRDGIEWSRPLVLLRSHLGWRIQTADGTGQIEWRAEDHPVAGLFLASVNGTQEKEAWIYVQHAVHGMSMRKALTRPHVARYRLSGARLLNLTVTALRSLSTSRRPWCRW